MLFISLFCYYKFEKYAFINYLATLGISRFIYIFVALVDNKENLSA